MTHKNLFRKNRIKQKWENIRRKTREFHLMLLAILVASIFRIGPLAVLLQILNTNLSFLVSSGFKWFMFIIEFINIFIMVLVVGGLYLLFIKIRDGRK